MTPPATLVDFVAVSLMVLQTLIIVYALWSFGILKRRIPREWTIFIITMLMMLLTRGFILVRELDGGSYPYIQYPFHYLVTFGLFLFIRGMRGKV